MYFYSSLFLVEACEALERPLYLLSTFPSIGTFDLLLAKTHYDYSIFTWGVIHMILEIVGLEEPTPIGIIDPIRWLVVEGVDQGLLLAHHTPDPLPIVLHVVVAFHFVVNILLLKYKFNIKIKG